MKRKIEAACNEIKALLISKNDKYGDSAMNPLRIFSKSDKKEQLLVRIDDKLKRILNQPLNEDEDVIQDLIGYLILLKIAIKEEQKCNGNTTRDTEYTWQNTINSTTPLTYSLEPKVNFQYTC